MNAGNPLWDCCNVRADDWHSNTKKKQKNNIYFFFCCSGRRFAVCIWRDSFLFIQFRLIDFEFYIWKRSSNRTHKVKSLPITNLLEAWYRKEKYVPIYIKKEFVTNESLCKHFQSEKKRRNKNNFFFQIHMNFDIWFFFQFCIYATKYLRIDWEIWFTFSMHTKYSFYPWMIFVVFMSQHSSQKFHLTFGENIKSELSRNIVMILFIRQVIVRSPIGTAKKKNDCKLFRTLKQAFLDHLKCTHPNTNYSNRKVLYKSKSFVNTIGLDEIE